MLTARQIVNEGIITGQLCDDNIQQVGIDLNVLKIQRIYGGGIIPEKGKTKLGQKELVQKQSGKEIGLENAVWVLEPGVYDVTFEQGCKIPANRTMILRQRSSLLRNGVNLHSSVFDPGFETEQIGTVMQVFVPIVIEYGARIAQALVYQHDAVDKDDLYNGQFQNDKQRENH